MFVSRELQCLLLEINQACSPLTLYSSCTPDGVMAPGQMPPT